MSEQQPDTASSGHGLTRRETLRTAGAAGAVVAGSATLAACGAGDAVSSATPAASPAASAATGALKAADVPVGGGTVIESLKVVVTQPTEGDYKAFSAVCPHQGCSVDSVADGVINCPCHGSEFDASTGAVKKGPATAGLAVKRVTVDGDGLTVS
jgi:Rieske Fe-S protein